MAKLQPLENIRFGEKTKHAFHSFIHSFFCIVFARVLSHALCEENEKKKYKVKVTIGLTYFKIRGLT